jgi:hypothetical protein
LSLAVGVACGFVLRCQPHNYVTEQRALKAWFDERACLLRLYHTVHPGANSSGESCHTSGSRAGTCAIGGKRPCQLNTGPCNCNCYSGQFPGCVQAAQESGGILEAARRGDPWAVSSYNALATDSSGPLARGKEPPQCLTSPMMTSLASWQRSRSTCSSRRCTSVCGLFKKPRTTSRAIIVTRSPLYSFTQTALLAGFHGAGG